MDYDYSGGDAGDDGFGNGACDDNDDGGGGSHMRDLVPAAGI